MATLNKATGYKVSPNDLFFFDTNIWIFLFAPIAKVDYQKQNIYGTLLKDIQQANAKIKVSSLIISEFTNAYLRICFGQWKEQKIKENREKYKDAKYKEHFRKTQEYKDAVEEAKNNALAILGLANKISDGFLSIDIEAILSDMEDKDFNDSYYLRLCQINRLKLVTDDGDLLSTKENIEIIIDRNV